MTDQPEVDPDVDVVVVGAGFAGLYLLHRLRGMGLSACGFESGADVGGTWYWNRYPGARCDVQSIDYSFSFDPELDREWEWSERYATQPEILRYLQHVADKHDLRRDICFSTRVESAVWDGESSTWRIRTRAVDPTSAGAAGDRVRGDRAPGEVTCRFYVMATGCLSVPKTPDVPGADRFAGQVYFTSRWPHDDVDFGGKRVGVIGTGSSGIQSIPLIAQQAAEVVVFQRTPNFSIPARNGPVDAVKRAAFEADPPGYREAARWSRAGVANPVATEGALQVSAGERRRRFESAWEEGTIFALLGTFNDILIDPAANATAAEFVREKIRAIVDDPETAESLCPTDYPVGTKRLCLDTGYYAIFNEPHVTLVDLRREPIESVSETGIATAVREFELDTIVYATGFDALTGAIVAVDIEGRDGVSLADRWADGPKTYLGLMSVGFPNLFMITGPQSPSVLSNMVVSIEQHVDWVCDAIDHLRAEGFDAIEPTAAAEAGWVTHTNDFADITLFPQANSWYMGANVPGKPRVVLPYVGGVDRYRRTCDDVVERGYVGFTLRRSPGPEGGRSSLRTRSNDGVIRRVQPDVTMMLELIDELGLPPIETLPVEEARAFSRAMGAQRPPGPEVGETVDGLLPGATGELAYRLHRPATPGPHPVVVYFHGGGWVLGDATSDDPFCRHLCAGADAVVVSVDYRHAPEHRFPAAPDDAVAAVRWVAEHAADLGGVPGELAVAGWSAGASLAAVACADLRDRGGPKIAGQLLVTPVTDAAQSTDSYRDNARGYVLTAGLMAWFWDHYADSGDRADPRASPLRAERFDGLPPAMIVTAEFDPLRDEGDAYAEALAAAGVPVRHRRCRGQIHTSLTAVDLLPSSRAARAEMIAALRGFFEPSMTRA